MTTTKRQENQVLYNQLIKQIQRLQTSALKLAMTQYSVGDRVIYKNEVWSSITDFDRAMQTAK